MSNENLSGPFNIPAPQSKDLAEKQTTCAAEIADAPSYTVAQQVKHTGEQASEAAHQAALAAPNWAPGASDQSALEEASKTTNAALEEASKTTNAAVAEGKHDVEAAYEHFKQLASSAVNTAASYLPTSVGGQSGSSPERNKVQETTSMFAETAASAASTAAQAVSSVKAMVQPHVDFIANAARDQYEQATSTVGQQCEEASATAGEIVQKGVDNTKAATQGTLQKTVDSVQPSINDAMSATRDALQQAKDSGELYAQDVKATAQTRNARQKTNELGQNERSQ